MTQISETPDIQRILANSGEFSAFGLARQPDWCEDMCLRNASP
jgi:hypothetical protein